MKIRIGLAIMIIMLGAGGTPWLAYCAEKSGAKSGADKPRLVMIEIPSWKTVFFGLPQELPYLIKPGETFDPKKRHYDFSEGCDAMAVFVQLKPKDKSAEAFRRFAKKWPLYQEFFKTIEAENYGEAEKYLGQIRKIDPTEPAAFFYLGSLKTQLKEYAEAEKNYQACLERFPDYGPAYINLARLVRARGDQAQAKKYLETAVAKLKDTDQKDAFLIAQKMLLSLTPEP